MIGIYKITSPTGKIYIGESVNIKNRFSKYNSMSCKNQPRLYNSFKKYGVKYHKFEIIEECLKSDLKKRERYWQDKYNVLNNNGLNCKLTQYDDVKVVYSKELRDRISKKMKGRTLSKATINKMKLSKKGTRPSKKICELAFKAKKSPIIQYDKKGVFIKEHDSVKEASIDIKRNISNLYEHLQGKRKSCGGYIFKYKVK